MPELGTVTNHGFDDEGYERRECIDAICECVVCGQDVYLSSETDMWEEGKDGKWHHAGYGPSAGVCCHKLYFDSWEGCEVYDLSGKGDDDNGIVGT